MALVDGDWSIAANGNIRSVAGSTNHRVIELHRWLMDKLDNATSSGDDLLDVTNGIIPSVRSTDNIITLNSPYNIDDTAAERFYDGSISQEGGNTLYSGLQVLGAVNSGTTELQIVQNNAKLTSHWGTGKNADAANSILLQIVIKSRSAGADIDGKRIRVQARELGDTYDYFNVTLGDGVSVAAINTQSDGFNQTAAGTIAGWGTVAFAEGFVPIDIDNNGANENYYVKADTGSQSEADTYERAKWIQRRGSATTIFGMNGELFIGVTHSFAYDNELTGPFVQNEVLTFGNGATAALLALDDQGTTGNMYVQLLTGVAPGDNDTISGGTSGATADIAGAVTSRNVNKNCFLGNYTGSMLGAYGVGFDTADVVAADQFTALDGVSRNPPNNVQIVATGLVSGDVIFSAKTKTHTTTASGAHSQGDTTLTLASGIPTTYDTIGRIVIDGVEHVFTSYTGATVTIAAPGLLSALTGGETVTVTQIYNDEFSLATGNNLGNGTLVINETIGSAWPTAGKVRVWNGTSYDVYSYTSYTGSTFTLSGTLSQNYTLNDPVFVPFIDETATGSSITKTIVYPGSSVPGRHRLYNASANIVPFEVPFSVGSSGSSSQLVRGSDA